MIFLQNFLIDELVIKNVNKDCEQIENDFMKMIN